MLLKPFNFHMPNSLNEAVQLYSTLENVKIQAGGTFLLNSLKLMKRKGTKSPDNILCLRKINELKGITLNNNTLTIKAMTTIDELYTSPILNDNFQVLKTVCHNISTQPIRNMATVGGNLTCRYTWTEMPATMIGLEANMHFIGVDGQKQIIPAEEFYMGAAKTDKILTHITINKVQNTSIAYRRIRKSQFVDIPLLSIFIKTTFEGEQWTKTIVSVNNCVAFAQRDNQLEEYLNKSKCTEKLASEALNHLTDQIYDTRSSDYKKEMFRYCLKSAINELINKRKK